MLLVIVCGSMALSAHPARLTMLRLRLVQYWMPRTFCDDMRQTTMAETVSRGSATAAAMVWNSPGQSRTHVIWGNRRSAGLTQFAAGDETEGFHLTRWSRLRRTKFWNAHLFTLSAVAETLSSGDRIDQLF